MLLRKVRDGKGGEYYRSGSTTGVSRGKEKKKGRREDEYLGLCNDF